MKKIFNIILAVGFLFAVSSVFTGCLVLLDDEFLEDFEIEVEYECNTTGTVKIDSNLPKSGSDAAYISNVYYRTSSNDSWKPCWSATTTGNPMWSDSNCRFKLEAGRYYFCVRVVYPNMSCRYDYYEDFDTFSRVTVSSGSTKTLYFDGDGLY